ncbi:hypothetical protein MMC25_003776 [Agyrium rufum]|nr:hypothetical protein [Agyrium rufum]
MSPHWADTYHTLMEEMSRGRRAEHRAIAREILTDRTARAQHGHKICPTCSAAGAACIYDDYHTRCVLCTARGIVASCCLPPTSSKESWKVDGSQRLESSNGDWLTMPMQPRRNFAIKVMALGDSESYGIRDSSLDSPPAWTVSKRLRENIPPETHQRTGKRQRTLLHHDDTLPDGFAREPTFTTPMVDKMTHLDLNQPSAQWHPRQYSSILASERYESLSELDRTDAQQTLSRVVKELNGLRDRLEDCQSA